MADIIEFRGSTEMSAAGRVSGNEFLSPAAGWHDFDSEPVEFSDPQARGGELLRRSTASHATVVLARARALRMRQAGTNP